ncbi:MAG: RlmE family RNA methyltransferase [Deltaproteobacteria bacterium]|jgi:23S rRNA (uridine2552-2'-O)-methyltransferase|nr:RlmE family RNA methyltransferase [Deltaproteobacteria bacterium]
MAIKDRKRALGETYAARARREGYPARSVYKLSEFDEKQKLLRPGQKILDLGCAPGSWSLYAQEKVGPRGRVIGVDLQKPALESGGTFIFAERDIALPPTPEIRAVGPFDLVLSDLAPRTTGRRDADSYRSLELSRAAFAWARSLLKERGDFLFKIFQGKETGDYLKGEIRLSFAKLILLKPKATRPESVEIFVLGRGFRGGGASPSGDGRAEI